MKLTNDFFNKAASLIRKMYFKNEEHGTTQNKSYWKTTKILEDFSNGVITYNKLIKVLAKECKVTHKEIHNVISNFVDDFQGYVFNNDEESVKEKQIKYQYAIINHNFDLLSMMDTVAFNKYNKDDKYVIIVKTMESDNTEKVYSVETSNDLEYLHNIALKYISWYNYPIGIKKNIQQYLSTL